MSLQGLQTGNYRLQSIIDSDGVIETYNAVEPSTGQQATIKVIRTDLAYNDAGSAATVQQLLSRAQALGKLDHPNILPLSGFGRVHVNAIALPCIITPSRQEKNLAQWLQEREAARLPVDEGSSIVHQIAQGLEYAHKRGIVHGRIAPVNIIVRDNLHQPYHAHVLLTNFDLSASQGAINVSQQGWAESAFSAPEQWHRETVPASDQYALAVLAYQLLTGHLPFKREIGDQIDQNPDVKLQLPGTFNLQLSQDIIFVLMHALDKNPQKRFASIAAFDRAFQSAIQQGQPAPTDVETVDKPVMTFKLDELSQQYGNGVEVPSAPQIREADQHSVQKGLSSPPVRLSLFTILLIALALCAIMSSLLVYYTAIYRPNQIYTLSTATSLVPTLTAQATAVTQAHLTATVTAYQDSFDQLTAGTPTLNDTMTHANDKAWDKVSNSRGSCMFTNQGYNVRANGKSQSFYCFSRANIFDNFIYQVQVRINQGDYCLLVFRGDVKRAAAYVLFLSTGGFYRLVVSPGPGLQFKTLEEGVTIPIPPGNTYQVAVAARGNNFNLFINGTYVDSVRDKDATSHSGIIGLGAGTINASSASIFYTNVQVWKL